MSCGVADKGTISDWVICLYSVPSVLFFSKKIFF